MINREATTSQQTEVSSFYEDEIDLFELWGILVKRKWQVLVVAFLVVAVSIAYAFLAKPVYKASGLVKIGGISDGNGRLVKLWDSSVNVGVIAKRLAKSIKVSIPKVGRIQASNIIEIAVEADSPEAAKRRLLKLTQTIIERHQSELQEFKKVRLQKIRGLERTINLLEEKTRGLEQITNDIEKKAKDSSSNASLAIVAILKLEAIKDQQNVVKLKNDLFALKQSISPFFLKPTSLYEISRSSEPIKPKKKLLLTLGVIAGFLCGILIAFLAELMRKSRSTIV